MCNDSVEAVGAARLSLQPQPLWTGGLSSPQNGQRLPSSSLPHIRHHPLPAWDRVLKAPPPLQAHAPSQVCQWKGPPARYQAAACTRQRCSSGLLVGKACAQAASHASVQGTKQRSGLPPPFWFIGPHLTFHSLSLFPFGWQTLPSAGSWHHISNPGSVPGATSWVPQPQQKHHRNDQKDEWSY